MNVFFIGMGYMGRERLKLIINLKKRFNIKILGYYDPKISSININDFIFRSEKNISKEFFLRNNINLCIISTPHSLIKKYSILCLKSNTSINLFLEKPFGLNVNEAKKIISYKSTKQKIFVGLNYRYFSCVSRLLNDIKKKKFGKINSIQVNFGHGHQPDILKSWKLKKKYAGGGVIIDPGIHVINLIQLIDKNLKIEYIKKTKNFWKTDVEEEAVIILSSKKIPIINLTLSIIKWRSTFEINGNGHKGYWRLSGRDRSYGKQTYVTGKKWGWLSGKNQNETEKKTVDTTKENVFQTEMIAVLNSILKIKNTQNPCNDIEALGTMNLIQKLYAR